MHTRLRSLSSLVFVMALVPRIASAQSAAPPSQQRATAPARAPASSTVTARVPPARAATAPTHASAASGAPANRPPRSNASASPAPARANVATRASAAPASSPPPPASASQAASSPAPDEHRAAIQRIEAQAARATPESARAIAQTVLRGTAPDVTATALDALAALARPEGSAAVAHALRHRRALIRRHAIGAARAIHTADLVDALGDLLGDPVAAVRLDAATALADVGNRAVGSRVLEAFERDLDDAQGPDGGPLTRPCAMAVGRFGSSDDVHHLLGFLGRAPLRAITDAMREAVRRAALPETLRVQIVTAIGRLATHDARVFLETVVADAGTQDNAVVRAARDGAARIGE